jgi:hypothetical protein
MIRSLEFRVIKFNFSNIFALPVAVLYWLELAAGTGFDTEADDG